MTDPELEGLCAQALNMALRDLRGGDFNFLLAIYHAGEGLHRMSKVEDMIIDRLGADWLNHGHTKDVGFRILRTSVDVLPPEAVVFVTGCNVFETTEKFYTELSPQEQRKILDAGHDRHHEAVEEGWLVMSDALVATAQTPERVCCYQQLMGTAGLIGRPETRLWPQATFNGRLKMFGDGGQS